MSASALCVCVCVCVRARGVCVCVRARGVCVCVYVCSDTVSRSGMFCAIATTIERCKTEGVVDVFQVVKALRVQKPGAVRNVVSIMYSHYIPLYCCYGVIILYLCEQLQYRIIFEAVLEYLDSFALYSNF